MMGSAIEPSGPSDVTDLLDQIEDSAKRHGEDSEPDHEVGDLQYALRLAWEHLTPIARREVHRKFFELHAHWDERA